MWKESGQGSRDVSCCEVVEDSKDDWTDCFVSLFRLVLNFSYTNVFGLEFWKGFGLWFWIFTVMKSSSQGHEVYHIVLRAWFDSCF